MVSTKNIYVKEKKEEEKKDNLHLDSSSMSVEGEYLEKEGEEEGILKITQGYSRDKRPDLKQFMIDLICTGDGDIPLYFRVGDGNESDQKVFAQIIKEYRIMMADRSVICG